MTRPNYISVPCPTCGAIAESKCTTLYGPNSIWKNTVRPHTARRKAFNAAAEESKLSRLQSAFGDHLAGNLSEKTKP